MPLPHVWKTRVVYITTALVGALAVVILGQHFLRTQQPAAPSTVADTTTALSTAHAAAVSTADLRALRKELFSAIGRQTTAPTENGAANERLTRIERMLDQLSDSQRNLAVVIDEARYDNGYDAGLTPEDEYTDLTPMEREEIVDNEAQAQTAEHIARIEDALLTEPVDPDWAPTATAALQDSFSAPALDAFDIRDAQCHSSLCRVELDVDVELAGPEAFAKLQHHTPWDGAGFIQLTNNPPGAVLFLAREGTDLPMEGDEEI